MKNEKQLCALIAHNDFDIKHFFQGLKYEVLQEVMISIQMKGTGWVDFVSHCSRNVKREIQNDLTMETTWRLISPELFRH